MPTDGTSVQDRLLSVFLYLGADWVLYLLLALSVVSIAIALERIVHFWQHSADVDALHAELERLLAKGQIDEAARLLKARPSHVASIAVHALAAFERGPGAVEEAMYAATGLERLRMERGLAFLGTLGNNAPFIGLFGTVLGIIRAFRDLSSNTLSGSSAVMAGIAEALVATAVGLLVALPAVATFNAFQRAIKRRLAGAEALARVVLGHAKAEPLRTPTVAPVRSGAGS